MIELDTNILVACVIPDPPAHDKVRERVDQFRLDGRRLALISGILAEFVHVVTDSKRFENPLTMTETLEWAAFGSDAVEAAIISTEIAARRPWLDWLGEHRLGMSRLLDTLIAALW